MAIVYRCRNCGHVLYVYDARNSLGLLTPSEVIERVGGRCPKCGRVLDRRYEVRVYG